MYRTRTPILALASALFVLACLPSTAFAISRDVVVARGRVWVDAVRVDPKTGRASRGVPYSQGAYALEDGTPTPGSTLGTPTAGYRTDCSGFVSMCFNLRNSQGRPYSTDTYAMGKNDSSMFKLTPIRQAELLPGDILLKSKVWYSGSSGHVIIFAGWSKADMSEYWALEQTGPCTRYGKRPFGQAGYRAFRFTGIDGFDRTRVIYGGAFTVSGTATKRSTGSAPQGSEPATSGAVDLALYDASGAMSSLVESVPVDTYGRFSITYTPQKNGKFAVRYRDKGVPASTSFLARDITVVPSLTNVSGYGSKIRRRTTYAFYGYLNPRVATSLRVSKYNKKKRTYVYYKTVRASVSKSNSSRGYKFTAKWKPTVAGGYRLIWQTDTPNGMVAAVSGNRYLTVK